MDAWSSERALSDPSELTSSLTWPFEFTWASTPSLISDPDGYFANETMLCTDDFDYPSWQEFECKVKEYEEREKQESLEADNLSGQLALSSTPPLCQLSPLLSSFTLKRNIYMDWIKPKLLAAPPLINDGMDIYETLAYIRFDVKARTDHFDFDTLVTSVANKVLLYHFCFSGVYNLNRLQRNALLEAISELIFGTKVHVLCAQHTPIFKLLEHRVKYFRDVMSRQFKPVRTMLQNI